MLYFILIFFIYIFIMAIINYYNSEVIAYMGLRECPRCKTLTHFYLKENKNQTVTFITCSRCHKKLQIAETLDIYSRFLYMNSLKNIPPPEECENIANTIKNNLTKIQENFIINISKSGKEEAKEILNYDINTLKDEILDYIEEKNYNKEYVLDLYNIIYINVILKT